LNARVLVLTGAGVSAESGIPAFRGKDGYWRNLDPAKLATPEAFARDPKLVWEWYRERRQRIRNAHTSKNSFQKVCFSALSDELPVHSREKRIARSRTSLQEM